MKILRITLILLGCLIVSLVLFQNQIVHLIVGPQKSTARSSYSTDANHLIDSLCNNITDYTDYHCHVIGLGANKTGCTLHPHLHQDFKPLDNFKFKIYKEACGIRNEEHLDEEYIKHLLELKHGLPFKSKSVVLAFDKYYDKNGNAIEEYTHFYVPNEYVIDLKNKYPNDFEACISINPYRKDALKELEKYGKQGVKQLKWLPNAMGINPSDRCIIPFYELMKKYDITLLSHTGDEHSVDTHLDQELGNPLLLRLPLDIGVKVIVAHCASIGEAIDLDHPELIKTQNFELFVRMMNNPKYDTLLFADISAITLANRSTDPLKVLLKNQQWHSRLLQGSDYPLPCIKQIITPNTLLKEGFIDEKYKTALHEIFEHNPLLYEIILKKLIHLPEQPDCKFKDEVFTKNKKLGY